MTKQQQPGSCLCKKKKKIYHENENSGERLGLLQESPWKIEMGRFFIAGESVGGWGGYFICTRGEERGMNERNRKKDNV